MYQEDEIDIDSVYQAAIQKREANKSKMSKNKKK
jgi:hypothetical protein